MLETLLMSRPSDRLNVLEDFDPTQSMWVVSDLTSKFQLQERLLRKYPVLETESVIRANELWVKLLEIVDPEINLISQELLEQYVKSHLEKVDTDWASQPGAAENIIGFLNQLFPILCHVEGPELLSEWFQKNPNSFSRWGDWAIESLKVWSSLLEKKVTTSNWAAGVLLNEDLSVLEIDRTIIFDFGVDMRPTELDLIQKLSEANQSTLLVPSPSWREDFEAELGAYNQFCKDSSHPSGEPSLIEPIEYRRFSSMLGEIKDCTAQVRRWCDTGVISSDISILAPDIGVYWPVLKEYLDVEGFTYNRADTSVLSSYLPIARWMAYLRTLNGTVSFEELEVAFFGEPPESVSYDRFKEVYSQILDEVDLGRDAQVESYFSKEEIDLEKETNLETFIGILVRAWLKVNGEKESVSHLNSLVKSFFESIVIDVSLSFSRWLECFEKMASRREVSIGEADASGIRIGDLSSSDNFTTPYRYFLGASDQGLRKFKLNAMSSEDAFSLSQASGFQVSGPEGSSDEFILNWLLSDYGKKAIVSYPESDLLGSPLTPSLVWLKGVSNQRDQIAELDVPQISRWDSFLRGDISDLKALRTSKNTNFDLLVDQIDRDCGENEYVFSTIEKTPNLSASSLEHYLQCPFIFFASRLLRLQDVALLDLDLDPRSRGLIVHALYASLSKHIDAPQMSDERLGEIVEECREQENILIVDDSLWAQQKLKFVAMAREFLQFEKKWKSQFPGSKIAYTEEPFQVYWNNETREFQTDMSEQGFLLRGRIDRIDEVDSGSVVIDYKSSVSGKRHFGSWVEKGELQLGVYALLGENEFLPSRTPILGSVYYDVKNFKRDVGLLCLEGDGKAFSINPRMSNKLDFTKKEIVLDSIKEEVGKIVESISESKFSPAPRELTDCKSCAWRSLCRAPHLN